MAFLGLEPRDHADERGALGEAVLLGQRAARVGVLVFLKVDAVVDQLDGSRRAPFFNELGDDRPTDRDEPIHRGSQPAQKRAIGIAADPARVDSADDERPRQTLLGQRECRARADDLRAIHMVVDDLGRTAHEQLDDAG